MHMRQNALNEWLKTLLNNDTYLLTPLTGDASFRRYFRLHHQQQTFIVMDAPPESENLGAFLKIATLLAQQHIHTPQILAVEQQQGFALLEDFGDQLFLSAITAESAPRLYRTAIDILVQLQHCPIPAQLPHFDEKHMLTEISYFQDWFLSAYLQMGLDTQTNQMLTQTYDWLVKDIAKQPQVCIHRDFHSRNLMVLQERTSADSPQLNGEIRAVQNILGVLDFQDAMQGPFTYDLVSLLKDCYIQWPKDQVVEWLTIAYQQFNLAAEYSWPRFKRAFDLCGLQRHLKVLGIFCRLHLRDHKSGYLRDLPLTFHYMMECLEIYPELACMHQVMRDRVQPIFLQKASGNNQ